MRVFVSEFLFSKGKCIQIKTICVSHSPKSLALDTHSSRGSQKDAFTEHFCKKENPQILASTSVPTWPLTILILSTPYRHGVLIQYWREAYQPSHEILLSSSALAPDSREIWTRRTNPRVQCPNTRVSLPVCRTASTV